MCWNAERQYAKTKTQNRDHTPVNRRLAGNIQLQIKMSYKEHSFSIILIKISSWAPNEPSVGEFQHEMEMLIACFRYNISIDKPWMSFSDLLQNWAFWSKYM